MKNFLILVLLGITIYLYLRNFTLNNEIETLTFKHNEIDTVYIDKEFTKKTLYTEEVEPKKISVSW